MRNIFCAGLGLLLTCAITPLSRASETTVDYSVQASASVQSEPARIILHWPQDSCATPQTYTIYRKAPDAGSWGKGVTVAGTSTEYVDANVQPGTVYEYQIVKAAAKYTGYGYLCAGIKIPLTENRGRLLLIVDNSQAKPLASELARLQQDLTGDGWQVTRLDVSRSESVTAVKG